MLSSSKAGKLYHFTLGVSGVTLKGVQPDTDALPCRFSSLCYLQSVILKVLGILLAELVAQVSARNRILFEASELQHDGRLNLALQDDRSTHLIQVA